MKLDPWPVSIRTTRSTGLWATERRTWILSPFLALRSSRRQDLSTAFAIHQERFFFGFQSLPGYTLAKPEPEFHSS